MFLFYLKFYSFIIVPDPIGLPMIIFFTEKRQNIFYEKEKRILWENSKSHFQGGEDWGECNL